MSSPSYPSGKGGRLARWARLAHNTFSFVGIFLINTAAIAWFFVLPVEASEGAQHPYLGILFLVILPGVFLTGFALLVLGVTLRHRKEARRKIAPRDPPLSDWQSFEARRIIIFVAVLTVANVVIGGYYTHSTVAYMDSSNFCGTSCHSMNPEFTAYRDSPHVNVACVDCHVGEGTRAYLESKLNGASQLVSTVLDNFPRPIPTPIHNLRPAHEVCETCHWPGMYGGFRFRVLPQYAPDEQNTPSKTVLIMRIGGGIWARGIHGVHVAPGVEIEYASDASRQNIPWTRHTDASGKATEYFMEDWNPDRLAELEVRTMDCLDCHTRPAHRFRLPERALNIALAIGQIDETLPWIKKQGLGILTTEYATTAEAEERIFRGLLDSYEEEHPEVLGDRRFDIEQAGRALVQVYKRNVFPEMNIGWGAYPDQIGHTDFPGCFRCHDEMHASPEGETITQDCSACHVLIAMEEPDQDIRNRLGID